MLTSGSDSFIGSRPGEARGATLTAAGAGTKRALCTVLWESPTGLLTAGGQHVDGARPVAPDPP